MSSILQSIRKWRDELKTRSFSFFNHFSTKHFSTSPTSTQPTPPTPPTPTSKRTDFYLDSDDEDTDYEFDMSNKPFYDNKTSDLQSTFQHLGQQSSSINSQTQKWNSALKLDNVFDTPNKQEPIKYNYQQASQISKQLPMNDKVKRYVEKLYNLKHVLTHGHWGLKFDSRMVCTENDPLSIYTISHQTSAHTYVMQYLFVNSIDRKKYVDYAFHLFDEMKQKQKKHPKQCFPLLNMIRSIKSTNNAFIHNKIPHKTLDRMAISKGLVMLYSKYMTRNNVCACFLLMSIGSRESETCKNYNILAATTVKIDQYNVHGYNYEHYPLEVPEIEYVGNVENAGVVAHRSKHLYSNDSNDSGYDDDGDDGDGDGDGNKDKSTTKSFMSKEERRFKFPNRSFEKSSLEPDKRVRKSTKRYLKFKQMKNNIASGSCTLIVAFVMQQLKQMNYPLFFLTNAAYIPGCKCYSTAAKSIGYDTYYVEDFLDSSYSPTEQRLKMELPQELISLWLQNQINVKKWSEFDCEKNCQDPLFKMYFMSPQTASKMIEYSMKFKQH